MNPPDHPRRATRRYEFVVAGLLVLAATFYFAHAALWSYAWQSKAHASFVPVTAMIIESSVQSTGSASATHGIAYSPRIVYRYEIDGRQYRSSRYFYAGGGWSGYASAKAIADGFRAGSPVRAYADADNPAQSVLDNSKPGLGMLSYLLPFAVLGLGAIAYGLRARPAR